MTILVADDDAVIRRMVLRALGARGWECASASSAAELERCARQLAPDVIISDVSLGDGDGISTCLRLREERPLLRVLIMTGDPKSAVRAEASGLGSALHKPFTLEELDTAFARALRT